ncbi:hypothetical protein [Pseudoalteromonas luteoviolacea]|uniref:Uncharacterized protein n=1 Tax=Pseudoalteromonas luteoviolacea S4054 TaxID=1129367 RepID=A0A0F6AH71_9GAMM|nr:hypothetical protein [Pseudoalteromonas luteoviolacea]AOT09159.1 hypothetical protein S4054249_15480 [Pseudoalteromonas luteoviolacea]AOT14072.1 hypothetical protein S40542_15450 [Pseudoalteromonas luteoviolacea]AOT18987.1 hypothetical protein S4054_15455 [Pseudoalteromonas luteoviolacea]KKE85141.1 hypothetical protein N479_06800 [Pseudoalteromonas luteoviolacea S4054]KZN70259.1 hypothetical protein N481_01910 [Pseudoalteromonas luteoviolacea S4047-1]
MRVIIGGIALTGLAGCMLSKPLAPKLNVPPKPLLQKSIFQISYSSELESARIKSVQLPAHAIKKRDSVFIDTSKVTITNELHDKMVSILSKKGLIVDNNENTDYHLVIQQADLTYGKDKVYVLNKPSSEHPYIAKISQTMPTKQCSNITASLSMRLTHNQSTDVVWFAKSSVDSAGFQGIPMQYTFTETQRISNEQEVLKFITEQNTDEARQARYNSAVNVPDYVVKPVQTPLVKVAGACTQEEVNTLTPKMMAKLTEGLIDKLNVQ